MNDSACEIQGCIEDAEYSVTIAHFPSEEVVGTRLLCSYHLMLMEETIA